ncbi:MAG: molecular chaperone DnaK [Candidatus Sumerlaeia bacterium]|nr:molecular chaperone DnaK [Candidatus Sumerlaeia bacterium]
MAKSIGIDLGTTNSVVSFILDSRVETIANAEGSRLTPSVVFYNGDDEKIVGELAKRQYILDSSNVLKSIKRIMGKRYSEVVADGLDLPYKVVELPGGMAGVELGSGKVLRPEEVSADILRKLRENAEDFIDEDIVDAVITVPAHFNDQQRTATKEAARLSGLNVTRILNEPTAAALAYGLGKSFRGKIAVFDFGGGTFDVSILNISEDIFEVISTNGDNHLGGDDIENNLFNLFCGEIQEKAGVDPRTDRTAVQRIREAAEKAKHDLSTLTSTQISLPFIIANEKGPQHYERSFSRKEFNDLNEELFNRLLIPCERALKDANLEPYDVDEVLLVGGSTRIPRVRELVEQYFGKKPNTSVNPDEAISAGAAIQGAVITGDIREVLLLDVTPLTLGIELAGGIFKPLIDRNATVPCQASKKFATVVDNQTTVLVRVLQGERLVAKENHFLAEFRLKDLPPAPKGLIEVEIIFSIDANGILSVSATDLTSGHRKEVVVDKYGDIGMPKEQIEQSVREAAQKREADYQYIQFAQKTTKADLLHKRANRIFDFAVDFLSEKEIKNLKEQLFKVDLAINDQNLREIDMLITAVEELLDSHEQNPRVQKALMLNQSQEFVPMPELPAPAGKPKQQIRISLDSNPKWEEGQAKIEGEQPAENALPEDLSAFIPSLEELETMAAQEIAELHEAEVRQSNIIKRPEVDVRVPTRNTPIPSAAPKSPLSAKPASVPAPVAAEPPKRKFAFAPPKVQTVTEEDAPGLDLNKLPPPK